MKYSDNYDEYWNEHKNDVCINVPKKGIRSRYELFREHIHNKSVLHIGCSDWPFTWEKIQSRDLLHQYLENIAGELYGIDASADGIKVMQQGGFSNVFVDDICNLDKNTTLLSKKIEVILLSEVIEHLANPGLAFEAVKKFIDNSNRRCEIIFTVPNYHNLWLYFLLGLRNKEVVHPDHNFYFSYRTFRTLLERYNFEVNDFCFVYYYQYPESIARSIVYPVLSHVAPCMAPYLYFKCHVGG